MEFKVLFKLEWNSEQSNLCKFIDENYNFSINVRLQRFLNLQAHFEIIIKLVIESEQMFYYRFKSS